MKIDEDSCDCAKSELELFDIPPTQTSIEESRFEPKYPKTSLVHGGPIEFEIVTGDEEYIDPNETFLYIKAKILDATGASLLEPVAAADPIPDKSMVFPIAYFIGTVFRQVEIKLSNKPVSSNEGMYAYRSYLETLLTYGKEAKNYQLDASLYFQDSETMDEYGEHLLVNTQNKGAQKRFQSTKFSRSFECTGPIHADIFQQPKLILSRCPMTLIFKRHDENFLLMSKLPKERYQVIIEEAVLWANYKKIAPHVRIAQEERLLSSNAKYPLRRVSMKFFTKGANRSDISEPNLVSGILPRRVIFGLVSTEAFNGSRHKNPFNFKNFGVNYVDMRKNGRSLPYSPLNLNFAANEYLLAYHTLIHATRLWRKNENNAIKPQTDYKNGFALYAYNLIPDHSDGSNFNLQEEGTLSLDLRLNTGVNESITIVCYLEFDTILEIDKNREVHYHE